MKRFLTWAIPLGLAVSLIYYFLGDAGAKEKEVLAEVKKGDFMIAVTSSGELFAKNSVNVMGASGINQAGVWQVHISNIVPEGKVIIKSETLKNVLFLPLEAIHSENKVSFVYKKEGINTIKQEVKLSKLNDNKAVIEKGLKEKDKVLMSIPLGQKS